MQLAWDEAQDLQALKAKRLRGRSDCTRSADLESPRRARLRGRRN